ncbi:glutaredoxin [Microstroma glucosiphilum]|uniref:Glutaredoxin n=1 Tax=Pseudomicrostroma glucosiphilum TaxID=1684307 RepID=A0A316UA44_9BASI|nr:glutaredoxin [Pseudomicrostroma glucosiphilum]PWN22029.1 glutaredoxin [Pseudomicrostroma glucosiphilum]
MMSATTNLVTIESPEQFTSVMSADLNRVSLLNFWAPWAEPCEQMNGVVKELAAKYPKILCLNIEAESQPDVSESFDVDSVPTFVLLRGHTLLSRVTGANASALASAVASHAAGPSSSSAGNGPSSSTSSAPRAAPSTYPGAVEGSIDAHSLHQPPESETEEELFERCKQIMKSNKVMLFMKGNPDQPKCGFSQKTVALLKQEGVGFGTFDILQDEAVRQGMKKLNDWPTFPQIFVQGELIGGLDILKEQIETGEFKELLQGPGA